MRPTVLTAASTLALSVLPRLGQSQRPPLLDTTRVEVASLAPRALAPSSRTIEVIDRTAIARLPALTVGELLARALGADLYSRSPASADLSIRGASFEQVLVLVDGVRVSDDQTGHFDLDLAVPLELVERIEILRGTGSAMHGADAVGGVVNIVTRQSRSRVLRAGAQGGSFGTAGASASAGITRDRSSLQLGAELLRSDGHRAGTDFDVLQARLGAAAGTPVGLLRADVAAARRDFGAADFYGAYPSHERTGSTTASVQLDARPASRLRTTATVAARQHTDRFTLWRDEPARYQNRHETWQLDGEMVARLEGAPVSGAMGIAGRQSQLRSARLGDREESRAALFGEASLGGDGARLDLGARGDWSSIFGAFLSPTVAAALPVGRLVHLRASATGGFRTPTWTERYYLDPANEGDPALDPERFWSGEVGARLGAGALRADVALFVRHAVDLIDWARPIDAPSTAVWRTMNVEEATFRGAELSIDATDPVGTTWTLRATGLDVDASEAADYVGKYALRPITRSASLRAWRALTSSLSAAAEVAHGRRAHERGWERIDGRLSWTRTGTRLDVDLVNLGGTNYLDAAGKPVAGRSVMVGVRWER